VAARGTPDDGRVSFHASKGVTTMIYVILAVIFIVLLFAYVRVRGKRLNG
jgi:hypothetical protein